MANGVGVGDRQVVEVGPRDAERVAAGVRRLTEPVHAHILDGDKPRVYEPFANFRCGEPDSKAVQEVELTARRLRSGATEQSQTPVVVEDAWDRMLGFCSVHSRPAGGYPGGEPHHWIAERYIVAFGRDRAYRGLLLRDNATWLGEALIRAALDMIALEAPDGPMPAVSALVRPENIASRRVLESLGFEHHPATDLWGQDLMWRRRGMLPPAALDEEVYVPPDPPLRVGRNDPCWCGSGLKRKKCHGG